MEVQGGPAHPNTSPALPTSLPRRQGPAEGILKTIMGLRGLSISDESTFDFEPSQEWIRWPGTRQAWLLTCQADKTIKSPQTEGRVSSKEAGTSTIDNPRQTALEATADRQRLKREQALAELARPYSRRDLEQQIPRRYKLGDVYAPHDLSGTEMGKWRKMRRKPRVVSHGSDVLDSLGVDPREHYKNFSMMGEYVSEMGRIKHRSETGLRPVNQRRMAKAIRRAIGTGLMPSTYRHPELLRDDLAGRGPRRG
ncbi:hypothetical protein LTR57_016462 [Friedmanniomyces endolithicus]|nr:hypothetical protein LTR57_016462 [Friedmanniomyces endolithicus]